MGKNLRKTGMGVAVSVASLAMLKSKKVRKFLTVKENFDDLVGMLQAVLSKFTQGGMNI